MPGRDYYLPSRRLVNQDDAAIVESANVPRSKFSGRWTRKTTFDAGYLVPFMVDEVLPGDHLTYDVTAYVRMSTPIFPILDNQQIDTFFFFVPCRILWDNWVRMMGEQDDPGDSIDFTVPAVQFASGGPALGTLADHFGLPTIGQIAAGEDMDVNALPFRAYNKIYNEWFRDQNVIPRAVEHKNDTVANFTDYPLRKRAKAHDYFTSALPWPQKGPTGVYAPLSGNAPIIGLGSDTTTANAGPLAVTETNGAIRNYAFFKQGNVATGINNIMMEMNAAAGASPLVFANLADATGVAINTFRQAFLVQQLLERDARGGTRYTELLRAHFGVTNPDGRLQRPEYIGGGQTPLIITPVAQTAPSTNGTVGDLGAAGTAAGSHRASYAATEHGYILALINVKSEISYQQGLHKMWWRRTRYDFYWPALSGLGEQAILRKEIYYRGPGQGVEDETVFGYQERWHEYRQRTNEVTGYFRSYVAGTMDNWHLAEYFLSAPTLSQTFIEDQSVSINERVLAAGPASANQQYIADILINRTAVRPIPTYGTPVSLGRF